MGPYDDRFRQSPEHLDATDGVLDANADTGELPVLLLLLLRERMVPSPTPIDDPSLRGVFPRPCAVHPLPDVCSPVEAAVERVFFHDAFVVHRSRSDRRPPEDDPILPVHDDDRLPHVPLALPGIALRLFPLRTLDLELGPIADELLDPRVLLEELVEVIRTSLLPARHGPWDEPVGDEWDDTFPPESSGSLIHPEEEGEEGAATRAPEVDGDEEDHGIEGSCVRTALTDGSLPVRMAQPLMFPPFPLGSQLLNEGPEFSGLHGGEAAEYGWATSGAIEGEGHTNGKEEVLP